MLLVCLFSLLLLLSFSPLLLSLSTICCSLCAFVVSSCSPLSTRLNVFLTIRIRIVDIVINAFVIIVYCSHLCVLCLFVSCHVSLFSSYCDLSLINNSFSSYYSSHFSYPDSVKLSIVYCIFVGFFICLF